MKDECLIIMISAFKDVPVHKICVCQCIQVRTCKVPKGNKKCSELGLRGHFFTEDALPKVCN